MADAVALDEVTIVPDQAAAEAIVRRECPDAREVSFVDHGHSNLIVQVGDQYVFRFPRSHTMIKRFEFETALLERLAAAVRPGGDSPVQLEQLAASAASPVLLIPTVYKKSAQPAFAIMRRLPGSHLQAAAVRGLATAEQQGIGRQIAEFVFAWQQAISASDLRQLRQETGVDEVEDDWQQYLAKVFAGVDDAKLAAQAGLNNDATQTSERQPTSLANDPRLRTIIAQHYKLWQSMLADEHMDLAVHGDLHEHNILFANGNLSGVLDFEFAAPGSIEQECRTLYRFGDELLTAFIERYEQLSGRRVHREHIRVWAIVGELATLCTRASRGQTAHPSYVRARNNLREWLPNFPL